MGSYETIHDTLSNAEFWANYHQCAKELESVQTVDEVIRICHSYFGKSSGDAFFPGGSGDVEPLSVLIDAGWSPIWVDAVYYFGIRQPDGQDALHYVEGDIYRGKGKPL